MIWKRLLSMTWRPTCLNQGGWTACSSLPGSATRRGCPWLWMYGTCYTFVWKDPFNKQVACRLLLFLCCVYVVLCARAFVLVLCVCGALCTSYWCCVVCMWCFVHELLFLCCVYVVLCARAFVLVLCVCGALCRLVCTFVHMWCFVQTCAPLYICGALCRLVCTFVHMWQCKSGLQADCWKSTTSKVCLVFHLQCVRHCVCSWFVALTCKGEMSEAYKSSVCKVIGIV